jgi:hypothetical protein
MVFRPHPRFERMIRYVGTSHVVTIPHEIMRYNKDAKTAVFEYNDLLNDMVLTLKK